MNALYPVFLVVHSWLRWIVLILALVAIVRSLMGWLGRKNYTSGDRQIGRFYSIALDIQFLVGLLLYFVFSPITTAGLRNFGGAMSNSDVRFFLVEHTLVMLLAVIAAHLAAVFVRRAKTDPNKHRNAAILYILSLLLVFAGIPWGSRPLFRM